MPEAYYRLRKSILGVVQNRDEKGFILVPAGAIMTLLRPCLQGESIVETRWDEKMLLMFAEDVHERGELLPHSSGSSSPSSCYPDNKGAGHDVHKERKAPFHAGVIVPQESIS